MGLVTARLPANTNLSLRPKDSDEDMQAARLQVRHGQLGERESLP